MPKRTNDFQRLVYQVRVNLAEGATVTESKMLTDRHTKRKREVDVCIEGSLGGQSVIVSVECRDHKRIADVSWVDAMKTKHDRLPTNALILASRTGFTPEARDVAAGYGIQVFSLSDVDEVDFQTLLSLKSALWTKTVTATAEKVLVRLQQTATLSAELVAVTRDNLVYTSKGDEVCQMGELVQRILNSKRAGESLLSDGNEEHVWFEMAWERPQDRLGNPLYMKRIVPETLREIESIQIKGPCRFQISPFGMRGGKLGDIDLAWGKTEIAGLDALVVATKDTAGIEKISINFAGK